MIRACRSKVPTDMIYFVNSSNEGGDTRFQVKSAKRFAELFEMYTLEWTPRNPYVD